VARSPFPRSPRPTSEELSRVVLVTPFELDTTQDATAGLVPDLLTLVKRLVHEMDQLEVSDPVTWAAHVATLTDDDHKNIFRYRIPDRHFIRYDVYGSQRSLLQQLHDELDAALNP